MHKEFITHTITNAAISDTMKVKELFDDLLTELNNIILDTDTREFSRAKEHMETACMYAVKAICVDKVNHIR